MGMGNCESLNQWVGARELPQENTEATEGEKLYRFFTDFTGDGKNFYFFGSDWFGLVRIGSDWFGAPGMNTDAH